MVKLKHFKHRVTGGFDRRGGSIVTVSVGRRHVGGILSIIAGTLVNSTAGRRFVRAVNIESFSLYIITVKSGFRDSLRAATLLGSLNTGFMLTQTDHSIRTGFLLEGNTSSMVCARGRATRELTMGCNSSGVFGCVRLGSRCSVCRVTIPSS